MRKLWQALRGVFSAKADGKKALSDYLVTIETPRLMLREFTAGDVDRIHDISRTPGFVYYCFDGTREKAEAFLRRAVDTQKPDIKTGKRSDVMLAICAKDTGDLVGHVSIESIFYNGMRHHEINFFVDPACQNKGYGREAAISMMRYGFEDMGIPHYTVTTHPDNHASKHVILTEGYKEIGKIDLQTARGLEPRIMFELTKEDFYKMREKDKRPMLLPRGPKP